MRANSKAKRKVARELIEQIDHLTARWHLGFSTVERNVIRCALEQFVTVGRPRHQTISELDHSPSGESPRSKLGGP